MKKLTINDFISRAKVLHSNEYDYSLSFYVNCRTKIKIICNIHGVFEQRPHDHLNGQGCFECSNTSLNKIEFILMNS